MLPQRFQHRIEQEVYGNYVYWGQLIRGHKEGFDRKNPPPLPDHEGLWQIQQRLQHLLDEEDYIQYEVSAYARSERRCRHNLNYWSFGDYLGIGAGAHGKISDAGSITRLSKVKQPSTYLAKAGTAEGVSSEQRLSTHDAITEFMMNALRLSDGFPLGLFQAHTGLPLSSITTPLKVAEEKGLISRNARAIRPTETGRRFLNDLLYLFLSGDEQERQRRIPSASITTGDTPTQ